MAKMTIGFGVVLVLVGAGWFVPTGSAHPTALIPCWFGLALAMCGVLAKTENASRRMLWMHIAVTIGLVGLIVPAARVGRTLAHTRDTAMTAVQRTAVTEQSVMAVVCFVFVVLCVRSFIDARRARTA